jgi:excisionase family DNA binding protein
VKTLTLEQTADLLQVTKRSVYNYLTRGRLASIRVGYSQRIVVNPDLEGRLSQRPDLKAAERYGPPADT